MRKLLLLPVVLLTLPAAMCETREPGIEVRTVYVPQPQPCVAKDEIPVEPPAVGDRLTGNKATDFDIVAPSALTLRAWGKWMHAALVACAE